MPLLQILNFGGYIMHLPLVSIIIPVYNSEKTLARCIESIINQKYQNTEIIIVNDGSTDNSMDICRKYAKQDSRIVLVDKDNSGVSDTRNVGISNASGEYLQFVDSDDWIPKNSTKSLVEKIQKTQCDMVIANFYRVINDKKAEKGHIDTEKVMNKKEFLSHMVKAPANFYYGVMWNKLYRRDIVTANRISCCTDISWCEDFLFNLDYIRYSETFSSLNVPVYFYVKNKNSLVEKQCTLKNIVSMKIKLFESYKELFESIQMYDEHRLEIKKFFIARAKDSGIGYIDSYLFKKVSGRKSVFKKPG